MANQDGVVVRSMSMEEFKEGYISRLRSPYAATIEGLRTGEVIVIKHIAPCKGKVGCSITSSVSNIRHHKSKGRQFMSRHLDDGNVAVACVAKPE